MMDIKTAICSTDDIQAASYLSYFFSCACLPLKPVEKSNFHIELCQTENFATDDWVLCAVTHPLLQSNENIPVKLIPSNKIQCMKEYTWINSGDCAIVNDLNSAISTFDDLNVLQCLMRLTRSIFDFIQKRRILFDDLEEAKVGRKTIPFIRKFAEKQGRNPEIDVSEFTCC